MTLSLLLIHLSFQAKATHIVGGEIYYEQDAINSTLYKITLHLFMDCENGNPGAIADDFRSVIALYDAGTNQYMRKFYVTRSNPKRIDTVNYNCVKPPDGVCVDKYTYVSYQTIDPGENGVILSYQRCCRNNTIDNLFLPGSTGATYWTKIPPKQVKNSSAIFKYLPPNYLCVDAPFTVDHSATDSDGDLLVYSLFQPYDGAARTDPQPDPPAAPPYSNVIWASPYNSFNQMGGVPLLQIDKNTGELTVTPNQTGQFVVGVKVTEYRDGVKVGETLRDYQFNVINCQFDILANFKTENAKIENGSYVFECTDTVKFVDLSLKAKSYSWDFGDKSTLDDTSSKINPWYIYPGNGDYTVTLSVKNEICEDKHKFKIRVRSKPTFNLGPDRVLCEEVDLLLDTKTSDASSVLWNDKFKGRTFRAQQVGLYWAEVKYDDCVYTDTVYIDKDPIVFKPLKDSLFCNEEDIDITMSLTAPGARYHWAPGGKADTLQNFRITKPGTYIGSAFNHYCLKRDTFRIWVATQPAIPDTFYCNDFTHEVNAGKIEQATYLWSNLSRKQQTNYSSGGTHWLQVKQRHCTKIDSFNILNPIVNVDLGPDEHHCDAFTKILDAGSDKQHFVWNTEQGTQKISVNLPGKYWVQATDQYGCYNSDTINIEVTPSPIIKIGRDTVICVSTPVTLGSNKEYPAYLWNEQSTSQFITTTDEGVYWQEVTDDRGCVGRDSVTIRTDPNALDNELFVPNAFTPNNDGLNDYFPYTDPVQQPDYYILIYSRWGEKIFDSRIAGIHHWDGIYKSSDTHNQTFFYMMEYTGCDGLRRYRKGTVNPLH